MNTTSEKNRARIEMQGFLGLNDREIAELNLWLRLSPAICMTWVAVGTYLASPAVLWALMPFAALGGFLNGHPFDVIYNHGIRHLTGTRRIPVYGKPRRFACRAMTIWLAVNGWAFYSGAMSLGYVLGGLGVLLPMINVTTGFCVPSFIYGVIFGQPQPSSAEQA